MYRLKWIASLDKVFMYLVDPHTGYPLTVKEYDYFDDAINDIFNESICESDLINPVDRNIIINDVGKFIVLSISSNSFK